MRKKLVELQGPFHLEREEDHPHVYWSVPKDWFPGGVFFTRAQLPELLRLLGRLPRSKARDVVLETVFRHVPRDGDSEALRGAVGRTLLPGFIVGGIGTGLVNAPLATTAVSTVRQERAGMASGLNNTFRQLGIATGIAGLGAIFASQVDPRAYTPHASDAVRTSFVAGLNHVLLVSAVVSLVGAVLAAVLVRPQDFIASGPQAT